MAADLGDKGLLGALRLMQDVLGPRESLSFRPDDDLRGDLREQIESAIIKKVEQNTKELFGETDKEIRKEGYGNW